MFLINLDRIRTVLDNIYTNESGDEDVVVLVVIFVAVAVVVFEGVNVVDDSVGEDVVGEVAGVEDGNGMEIGVLLFCIVVGLLHCCCR